MATMQYSQTDSSSNKIAPKIYLQPSRKTHKNPKHFTWHHCMLVEGNQIAQKVR